MNLNNVSMPIQVPSPLYSGARARVRGEGRDQCEHESISQRSDSANEFAVCFELVTTPSPWPSPPSTGEREYGTRR